MKSRILFIVVVLLFVALVPGVYWLLFERGLSVSDPSSPRPAAPAGLSAKVMEEHKAAIPLALAVTELSGQVKIERNGVPGWQTAEEGMVLAAKDRIRTEDRSRATLAMPGVFSVRLTPKSDFRVRQLAEDAFKFLLEEGMIAADVQENPKRLFEVAASSSLATTRGGSFRMHVDQEGRVSLGASRGQVDLESAGKVVTVREGYFSRAGAGAVPDDPIRIPSKLFLKVRWPSQRDLASRSLVVSGKTDVGARVYVDGVTVEVDRRGHFRKVVSLEEGANQLDVHAEDVGGNEARARSGMLKVDTRGDGFQIKTSPEMWEKKDGGAPG